MVEKEKMLLLFKNKKYQERNCEFASKLTGALEINTAEPRISVGSVQDFLVCELLLIFCLQNLVISGNESLKFLCLIKSLRVNEKF